MGEDPAIADLRVRVARLTEQMRVARADLDSVMGRLVDLTDVVGRGPTQTPTSSGPSSGETE